MTSTPKPKALVVAEYFIHKNRQDKKGLSNKKLQKLLYYSQAWSLALRNKKLFDEEIEAWIHGPAVPVVYFAYKKFGFKEIDKEVDEQSLSSRLTSNERKLLDTIWRVYGKYDAEYLEVLSHNEKPWQEARKDIAPYEASSNLISLQAMKEYYGQKIKGG